MTYSLLVDRPWRYRHPGRGMQVLAPGRYRVPDEVAESIAQRALAEGMARREATFGEKFAKVFGSNAPAPAAKQQSSRRPRKARPKAIMTASAPDAAGQSG